MSTPDLIAAFLAGRRFAVVGASRDREKYGNKVLRCYLQNGREVVPVNPKESTIEGLACAPNLTAIQGSVDGVSIITPPAVTVKVVEEAARLGIKRLWMQPGAESEEALAAARRHGLDVIADGSCILVALRYRE